MSWKNNPGAIIQRDNYPGGNFLWEQLSSGAIVRGSIIRGAIIQGEIIWGAIIQGVIFLRGNFPDTERQLSRGQFYLGTIILGGTCPGRNYPGGFSPGAIILGGNYPAGNHPGGNYLGAIIRGVIFLGGNCPDTVYTIVNCYFTVIFFFNKFTDSFNFFLNLCL